MAKCSCSLDLGLHPFPQSKSQEEDLLEKRFPSLNEELTNKTEENYFSDACPRFKLFPPIVRPDSKLGRFPPSSCPEENNKENAKWLKLVGALNSEQIVAKQCIDFFNKNTGFEGFLFHPFHTDTYLAKLKERAKSDRKGEANREKCDYSLLPLTKLEIEICECLGVNITEIVEKSVSNLTCEEIDDKIEVEVNAIKKENLRKIFQSWVNKNLQTDKNKRNYLAYTFYKREIYEKRNCEIDMLLVLESYRSIVEIEVKSVTDMKSINNVLKCAADQLKNGNRTIEGCHQDILNKDWNFVRVIAIPNIDKTMIDEETCCKHCSNFIIDIADIGNRGLWMKNILSMLPNSSCSSDIYKKLFTRIVGFYSCSLNHGVSVTMSHRDARIENEKAITGNDTGISSEDTVPEEPLPNNFDNLHFKDFEKSKNKKGQRSSEMIYWNHSQLSLLLENEETKKRVLFDSDFGCGKTLLMKHFASLLSKHELSKNETTQKPKRVFFVSLAAAKGQQLQNINGTIFQSYRRPAVIDIANEMDFQGKDVQVIGVKYLIDHYYDKLKDTKCLNDLLVMFMKDNHGDHFFIDELPTTVSRGATRNSTQFYGPDLTHLQGPESKEGYVWIALRPTEIKVYMYGNYEMKALTYKTKMLQDGFHIPVLSHNMRNSSSVIETIDSLYKYNTIKFEKQPKRKHKRSLKMSVPKAPLPPNPVLGNPPVIVPIIKSAGYNMGIIVPSIIEKYFEPKEPVVILVVRRKRVFQVVEGCKKKFSQERNITDYCTSADSFKDDGAEGLKHYLTHPEGILITDADAFGGMQARNIVVVGGDESYIVRNYIMRAISQIIFIQEIKLIHIFVDLNPSIIVDFIDLNPSMVFDRTYSWKNRPPHLWLWHFPYGISEGDIKEHFRNMSKEENLLAVERLTHEDNFVGYKLTVKIEQEGNDFLDNQDLFWPPGWMAKRYDIRLVKCHSWKAKTAPQIIFLLGAENEDRIVSYGRERGITVLRVKREENTSQFCWYVKVGKEDYKSVIDPEFWKSAGWRVEINNAYWRKDDWKIKNNYDF